MRPVSRPRRPRRAAGGGRAGPPPLEPFRHTSDGLADLPVALPEGVGTAAPPRVFDEECAAGTDDPEREDAAPGGGIGRHDVPIIRTEYEDHVGLADERLRQDLRTVARQVEAQGRRRVTGMLG